MKLYQKNHTITVSPIAWQSERLDSHGFIQNKVALLKINSVTAITTSIPSTILRVINQSHQQGNNDDDTIYKQEAMLLSASTRQVSMAVS